jgi:hypothetical protein
MSRSPRRSRRSCRWGSTRTRPPASTPRADQCALGEANGASGSDSSDETEERAKDTRQGPAGALLSAHGLSHAQRLPVLHQSTQTDWRSDRWTDSPSGCLGELTSGLPHHRDDLCLSLPLTHPSSLLSSPWTECGAGCSRALVRSTCLARYLPACLTLACPIGLAHPAWSCQLPRI